MKDIPATLVRFLAGRTSFIFANLYTFALVNGITLRWTDQQYDLTIPQITGDPLTWIAQDVMPSGLTFKSSIGLAADQQTIDLVYAPPSSASPSLVGTVPIAQALLQGQFDGATVRRSVAIYDTYDDALPVGWGDITPLGVAYPGHSTLFYGLVSTIQSIGKVEAKLSAKSQLMLLDVDMPRNYWQSSCQHVFCDAGCTLSRAAFTASGTVGAGATKTRVPWTGSATTYTLGTITFVTGANAGVTATVKQADASGLTLAFPLVNTPAGGDTFTATQGCDKTMTRCTALGNLLNFDGFPFVPVPETAV